MITLLIIAAVVLIAFLYLLQYQIVRDYLPIKDTFSIGKPLEKHSYKCLIKRYSIFDFNYIFRRWL